MARDWLTCTALTAGAAGSLNAIDGATLSDGDGALVLLVTSVPGDLMPTSVGGR